MSQPPVSPDDQNPYGAPPPQPPAGPPPGYGAPDQPPAYGAPGQMPGYGAPGQPPGYAQPQYVAAGVPRPPIPGVPADLGQRALARLIDAVIAFLAAVVLLGVMTLIAGVGAANSDTSAGAATGLAAVGFGLILFFWGPALFPFFMFLLDWGFTAFMGGTPGKKVMKIKIVNEVTGGRISVTEALVRALLTSFLWYACFFGFIVCISPAFDSTGRMQGWQDRGAKTAVVKV